MTIAAICALIFGFAAIALVASDIPRLRANKDWLDYCINAGVGLGGICTIAVALRALV